MVRVLGARIDGGGLHWPLTGYNSEETNRIEGEMMRERLKDWLYRGALAGAGCFLARQIPPLFGGKPEAASKSWPSPPRMTLDPEHQYAATILTSEGDMTLDLLVDQAPKTVNNFVFLAREGFYENVPFHRILKGFMVQTGDPTGTGTGGPGYQFDDEPVTLTYAKGIVAMANAGPNTNGSQFFIVHADEAPLPPQYTVFGRLRDGFETLDAIASIPVTSSSSGERSKPSRNIRIESVRITEV